MAKPDRDRARRIFDAVGELATAIHPHNMDREQRERVRAALTALVDEIIAIGQGKP